MNHEDFIIDCPVGGHEIEARVKQLFGKAHDVGLELSNRLTSPFHSIGVLQRIFSHQISVQIIPFFDEIEKLLHMHL